MPMLDLRSCDRGVGQSSALRRRRTPGRPARRRRGAGPRSGHHLVPLACPWPARRTADDEL